MWIAILILLIAVLAVVLFMILRKDQRPASREAESTAPAPLPLGRADEIPFTTTEIEQAVDECYRIAFSLTRFEPQVPDDHVPVLDAISKSLDESVYERDYFPRRPMLLPRLLQAINDDESTREELVRVLLEDPALAGAVLQRANSAYYRTSPEPIESLDRAVMLLGTNGLRSLMASAILQPVFRIPRGSFEKFADFTWEQAERTAMAAEVHARTGGDIKPIVAQLLGLMSLLANIVLFRLALDKYRDFPHLTPRADVIIEAIRTQRACTASLIAQSWKLSDLSIAAFTEQQQKLPPEQMSSIGRSVYFGDLCGSLAMLTARGYYTKKQAQVIISGQGADRETTLAMWLASASVAQS
ncbi:MAG TPA: HDOD domain-containing protein [Povalibacter sp.]|uniref:HDOD domain-containing protein n=1 Tax=Povalibacter sp. TaxID=1962978 RepID=UPI002B5ECEB6|nr:HDOD domain-containing protein [Povalibacter sp.]HMN44337.1 HDOD domain-containing protein [Povalibacter sp.]